MSASQENSPNILQQSSKTSKPVYNKLKLGKVTNKKCKAKQKQKLLRTKEVLKLVTSANNTPPSLDGFPEYMSFHRHELDVRLKYSIAKTLSGEAKKYIMWLLKENMADKYGKEWSKQEKIKCKEMSEPDAHFLLLEDLQRQTEKTAKQAVDIECKSIEVDKTIKDVSVKEQNVEERGNTLGGARITNPTCELPSFRGSLVGFVQFRYVEEEGFAVLYIYELQLESAVQHHGLGKFLMELLELMARESNMEGIMLTVQKTNLKAMDFYLRKLNFQIASISPSKVNPSAANDYDYEILSKMF